jgi:DNA-directed RNA polymerases I and III subunit RPAC2
MVEPAVQGPDGLDKYINGGVPSTSGPKVSVISSEKEDPGQATFCIRDEDHTLGNALRYVIMKKYFVLISPSVLFCAYSIPHPSEYLLNLRIQTDNTITAVDAFHQGLNDLESLAATIGEKFSHGMDEYSD